MAIRAAALSLMMTPKLRLVFAVVATKMNLEAAVAVS